MEMSQHFEMTDATPLACSVIVIQSYAKVASTLLHFTNQIGLLKGSIDDRPTLQSTNVHTNKIGKY